MRWRARTIVQRQVRRRASRPQLKRDPLGGALPPHKHSSVNSFGMVTREAPRAETHGRAPARRAPPLQGGHVSGAQRTSSSAVAAQKQRPKACQPNLPSRARRARAFDNKRAV